MSTIRVREHQLDDVVSKLVAFDRDQNAGNSGSHLYLLCGKRLVPGLQVLVRPRLLGNYLKRGQWIDRCVRLPFHADVIQIKNNIRVFGYGPKEDLTAKIALAGLFRRGTLFREVHARRLLAQTIKPSFGVAPMLSYDRHGARWFVEAQIPVDPEGDAVMDEFIADHALGFYRSTLRTRVIGEQRIEGLPISTIISFLPEASRRHLAETVASLYWPVAFGHGDVGKGNMIRDVQGKLYLIDWEKAGVVPVAFDLRRLYAGQPKLRDAILSLVGALGQQRTNAASPKIQMALAFAAEAAALERDRRNATQYFAQRDRIGVQQANQNVQNLISRNQQLAATLVSAT